jgi:hypothetical protein
MISFYSSISSVRKVVSFTVQRVLVVISPLANKSITKKSAWTSVFIILLTSLTINSWIPFAYEIRSEEYTLKYCEIKKEWQSEYFTLMIVYIFIILIIPIVVVLTGNFLIINKTKKADLMRKDYLKMSPATAVNSRQKQNSLEPKLRHYARRNALIVTKFNFRFKLFYSNPKTNITNRTVNTSKYLPRILATISFCYALLNLPYLLAWLLFYQGK